jgi:hypothetical protein
MTQKPSTRNHNLGPLRHAITGGGPAISGASSNSPHASTNRCRVFSTPTTSSAETAACQQYLGENMVMRRLLGDASPHLE